MPGTFRGFVSVELPPLPSVREFREALERCGADLKLTPLENCHLTLRFLGETREEHVPAILDAIRGSARGVLPFRMSLRGAGAFPNLNRPRVVWIGIPEASTLSALASRLEKGLQALGMTPADKPFSAHVTLARTRAPRELQALAACVRAFQATEFGDVDVREIRLMRSELRQEGPAYTAMGAVPLPPEEAHAGT